MRYFLLICIITFGSHINAQRVHKFSTNIQSNFYSYGEGYGSLNDVVRLAEGISFTYKTIDTSKAKGMIYEFTANTTSAYYQNILSGNSILEVSDFYTNLNFIFPILILQTKRIEQCIGVGIGIGALASRDYLDENNNVLNYNSTTLKELKFGRYFTNGLLLDYQIDIKLSKRIGFNLGARYTTSTPIHKGDANYIVTQGTGLSFKYGVFYQF